MTQPSRDWPTLMDLETAGAYLSLSTGVLAGLLRREGVSPVAVGSRLKRWRRHDLDLLVDRMCGAVGEDLETACANTTEGLDSALAALAALAAVERRAAKLTRTRKRHEVRQSHPSA